MSLAEMTHNETCDQIESLASRVDALERSNESLRALLSAEKGRTPPMELGNTFYPPGDAIPSRGPADLLDGMIYSFKAGKHGYQFPFVFRKNSTGGVLKAGDKFELGVVDVTLRCPCEPNNFFFLEI